MPHFENKKSILKFEQKVKFLNNQILNRSDKMFDLGNFVNTNFSLSSKNISGTVNESLLPQAKSYFDDELRAQTISLINENKNFPPQKISNFLIKLLTRTVLYVGSECERESFIGVESEYNDLIKVLKSEFMEIKRVKNPTLRNLMRDWGKYKPSIIYISSHGLPFSLFLKDEQGNCKEYNNDDLAEFFRARSLFTECVILSACESLTLGKLIAASCRNVVCINRMVDINTARLFCNVLMEYLNDYSLQNASVYEDAFNFSKKYVNFEGLRDAFAFEFLKADLTIN